MSEAFHFFLRNLGIDHLGSHIKNGSIVHVFFRATFSRGLFCSRRPTPGACGPGDPARPRGAVVPRVLPAVRHPGRRVPAPSLQRLAVPGVRERKDMRKHIAREVFLKAASRPEDQAEETTGSKP